MNTLQEFNMFIEAAEAKERAVSFRKSSMGIAVDSDKHALDYQSADCISRITKRNVKTMLGEKFVSPMCPYCGYEGVCECDWLKERGIDTRHIRIEEGIVYYKE